jgi:RNA polymerase sigma-70 factor, ECF subfamily
LRDKYENLHTYISSLRRYAMALVRNADDADDLVQETLTRAIAYLRSGREIRNVRGYLFSILHNLRITQAQQNGADDAHVPVDDIVDQLAVPSNQDDYLELKALLKALRDLPKEQREVVLLTCVEGFRYRETAAILGVPVGTVMSRLSRARRTLIEQSDGERAVDEREAALKVVK